MPGLSDPVPLATEFPERHSLAVDGNFGVIPRRGGIAGIATGREGGAANVIGQRAGRHPEAVHLLAGERVELDRDVCRGVQRDRGREQRLDANLRGLLVPGILAVCEFESCDLVVGAAGPAEPPRALPMIIEAVRGKRGVGEGTLHVRRDVEYGRGVSHCRCRRLLRFRAPKYERLGSPAEAALRTAAVVV